MTIQEQINALKKEFEEKMKIMTTEFNANIAELEKQAKVEEQKKNGVFIPGESEQYWYLTSNDYDCDECIYNDVVMYSSDEKRLIRGNCFKTEKEVAWADKHRIVETELRNFVMENDPDPITEEDWADGQVFKFYIYYEYGRDQIVTSHQISVKHANQVYASNMQVLKQAIELIGEERLKKYYFGV